MSKKRIPPIGQVRQSQVISTFGPGSMLDLPDVSVMVRGLEHWSLPRQAISEPRLQAKIARQFLVPSVRLEAPPVHTDEIGRASPAISCIQFPIWFLASIEQTHEEIVNGQPRKYRTRPLVPLRQLEGGKWVGPDRKKHEVVPVRFVRACVRGHIEDIDWHGFLHAGAQVADELWLDEGGAGNDFREIYVRSSRTGIRRQLAEAVGSDRKTLGQCRGRSPWLQLGKDYPCEENSRLLVRHASNAYFASSLSVISIPEPDTALRTAIAACGLGAIPSREVLDWELSKEHVKNALAAFTSEQVWREIQRGKTEPTTEEKTIKDAEIVVLRSPPPPTEDVEFSAQEHPFPAGTLPPQIEKVVLIDRLREVRAQVGFTRFEAAMPDIDGELSLGVKLAPLSEDTSWFPATEIHGEGVFLGVSAAAIDTWLRRPSVQERQAVLARGFDIWCRRKNLTGLSFVGLPYIMLQSFAHLLLTTFSLECGYSSSALRERVYASDDGYGVLLYTGSPASEGTLGGMIEAGKRLPRLLAEALERGRLCSNDPVCAQHDPADPHEERYLHGAACHGCLLIAETCCEQRNELLDRSLVVPTVLQAGCEFFGDAGMDE